MIEKMLNVERGDKVFPQKNAVAFAEIDREEVGRSAFQRQSFGVDTEYTLSLKVGVDFISNDVELQLKTEKAKKQLMHTLFQDVISDLHEIGNLADRGEVSRKVYSLIEKLHNA